MRSERPRYRNHNHAAIPLPGSRASHFQHKEQVAFTDTGKPKRTSPLPRNGSHQRRLPINSDRRSNGSRSFVFWSLANPHNRPGGGKREDLVVKMAQGEIPGLSRFPL